MMDRMSRPQNAAKLIQLHQEWLSELSELRGSADSCKLELVNYVQKNLDEKTLAALKQVDIDELNRDKAGIRIKLLRESGYSSIADIVLASKSEIASIRGISWETAELIKRRAQDYFSISRKSLVFQISADRRTPSATRAVQLLSKIRALDPIAQKCSALLESEEKNIKELIKELLPGRSPFTWFFTSFPKKKAAISAFRALSILADDEEGYGYEVRLQLALFQKSKNHSPEDAWQDFIEHSIQFFTLLEDICPEALGGSGTTYGLPDDLAREIQDQSFFPDGLLCDLRRYQEWGVKYILHQERVLLGDEMGLGKTIQAIATMVSLRNTGATHFMVICPASVLTNWCREIKAKSRLSPIKIHGADRSLALQSWIKEGGVAVTNYEITGSICFPDSFRFSLLVVDEAHYVKNIEAGRSVNVRTISTYAQRILFMTGTALENKVDEMIDLIGYLQPSIAQQAQSVAFLAAAPNFREIVSPVYYRRKRADVLKELPEKEELEEWCTLENYEEITQYESAVLRKDYMGARRVSWNIEDISKSCKAKRLLDIVKEAADQGRKILVFSFFLDTIDKVQSLLGDQCMGPIRGSIPTDHRQQIIDNFNSAPAGTVLVAQIQSGGTGLNIQSASVVILCEPQLKPSIENQAISRVHRMGQARNVLVYRLLCEGTIEEKIMHMLHDKQRTYDAFADRSVAAEKNEDESDEIDNKTMGAIISEEIERIKAKQAQGNI